MSGAELKGRLEPIGRPMALVAAVAAFTCVAASAFDIFAGSMAQGALGKGGLEGLDAVGRLDLMARNPLLGIYLLDFLNLLTCYLSLPLYLALARLHRKAVPGLSLGALILFCLGTAAFTSANAALPMFGLAGKYAQAAQGAGRDSLVAAAEALLSRGAHGSPGALPGFLLPSFAMVLMSLAMLRGRGFGRLAPILGILGGSLLSAYLGVVTFIPELSPYLIPLAMPGGLCSMAWMVLSGIALARIPSGG